MFIYYILVIQCQITKKKGALFNEFNYLINIAGLCHKLIYIICVICPAIFINYLDNRSTGNGKNR